MSLVSLRKEIFGFLSLSWLFPPAPPLLDPVSLPRSGAPCPALCALPSLGEKAPAKHGRPAVDISQGGRSSQHRLYLAQLSIELVSDAAQGGVSHDHAEAFSCPKDTTNQEGINCPCTEKFGLIFSRVLPPQDPQRCPQALCPDKLTLPTGPSTSPHPCYILS